MVARNAAARPVCRRTAVSFWPSDDNEISSANVVNGASRSARSAAERLVPVKAANWSSFAIVLASSDAPKKTLLPMPLILPRIKPCVNNVCKTRPYSQ